jgi:hypothetical protein
MFLSTVIFALLVSDLAIGSMIVTRVVYKSGTRLIKPLVYSFKQKMKSTPNVIQSSNKIIEYDVTYDSLDLELLPESNLLNIEYIMFRIILFCIFYSYYQYFNIKNVNYKNSEIGLITWEYLTGLIETDGSFKISLDKKGKYKPIVSISQKNTELLYKIQAFLKTYKINSTLDIYDPQKSNRAPQLRIQGSKQILNFCNLLEDNVDILSFCSQKYRDFLILKEALSNLNIDSKIKIDLMLSLHKTCLNQLDIKAYKYKLSRKDHEKRLNLVIGSSKEAAKALLIQIDKKFNNHKSNIENSILNNTQIFNNDWCVGIMDGDGCFSISIEFITEGNKRRVQFIPMFQLVMEADARLTIQMFKSMVGCEGRLIEHKNQNKEVTAIYYRVNRIDELKKLLVFFKIYNTRNLVRKEQLNLVKKLFELKETNDNFTNPEILSDFIRECYKVTELGKGKGKRKYTLQEALEKINNWLN